MEQNEWKIQFCWVKAHAGNLGNELADTLAKGAATNLDIAECYNRVPKIVVKSELEDRSVDKWQSAWNRTTKGKMTKGYFPIVAERLKMKITPTHNLTTILTGHGNVNAYLHQHAHVAIQTKQ
jgi:P2-related tail formation protein